MPYWKWLALLSVVVLVGERLRPRDATLGTRRPGFDTDVLYLLWNGHWLGVWLAPWASSVSGAFDRAAHAIGLDFAIGVASAWPVPVQFVVAFFAVDLVQWSIHNLLHRMPWLWRFHAVHHSIVDMDFLGSLRFHALEAVLYKALQYVPLAILGFSGDVLFGLAIVGTLIGHLNHANLRLPVGPWIYLLNHPAVHIWHHAHPDAAVDGKPLPQHGVNFGINLSLWDWLFGTLYVPSDARPPRRLGFPGIEGYPQSFLEQWIAPFRRSR